jgi:hypothetical protein
MTRERAAEIIDEAIALLFDEADSDDPECEVTPVIVGLGELKEWVQTTGAIE